VKLKLETKVPGHYKEIMELFDLKLFEALKPKGANMEIVEFTGSKKGDTVHIRFVSPIKAVWISKITEHGADAQKAYFVDEGATLPWPLKKWKHIHIVEKIDDTNSLIVDDISFTSNNRILDFFIYPALYLGFYPRKAVYRKYFSNLFS